MDLFGMKEHDGRHDEVERQLRPLDRKVYVIVNYHDFTIAPQALDSYLGMVQTLARECYLEVNRYGVPPQLEAAGLSRRDRVADYLVGA